METCELISKPDLAELKDKCSFKETKQAGPAKTSENPPDDDEDSVEAIQENNGGILGTNLQEGKGGVADGGPGSTKADLKGYLFEQKANDSQRGHRIRLRLKSYRDIAAGDFPLTVAAHHLIPGNASLYKIDAKLIPYMEDGGKVKTIHGRSVTIEGDIGYDVNGSHNGVWLPGNYAIKRARPERKVKGEVIPARVGTSPKPELSWSGLEKGGYEDWQFAYVAGACKAAGGQFHDSHASPYSESVTRELMKIVTALSHHLESGCEHCKGTKVPPPFKIKQRLYSLSMKLRGYVSGAPTAWKDPWFTSERWSREFFQGGKVTPKFLEAYNQAEQTGPGEP